MKISVPPGRIRTAASRAIGKGSSSSPVTIAWSICPGSPVKNRCTAAGSVASKAEVLSAPSSAAACSTPLGIAAR